MDRACSKHSNPYLPINKYKYRSKDNIKIYLKETYYGVNWFKTETSGVIV
jgi:hypothetical protein